MPIDEARGTLALYCVSMTGGLNANPCCVCKRIFSKKENEQV